MSVFDHDDLHLQPDSKIRSDAIADLPLGVSEGEAVHYAMGVQAVLALLTHMPAQQYGAVCTKLAELGDRIIIPGSFLLGLKNGGLTAYRRLALHEKETGTH